MWLRGRQQEQKGGDIEVVGEAADGLELLDLARVAAVDVFLVDVTMPKLNGIEAIRELRHRLPASRCVVLSLHGTRPLVEEALAAGARGYLTKDTATRTVVDAVLQVHAGHSYLCPNVAHLVTLDPVPAKKGVRRGAATPLSGQERRVLQLIAEGRTNKEMAVLLDISVNTVHVHRTNLMAKLDLHRAGDLIRYAIRAGIAKL